MTALVYTLLLNILASFVIIIALLGNIARSISITAFAAVPIPNLVSTPGTQPEPNNAGGTLGGASAYPANRSG